MSNAVILAAKGSESKAGEGVSEEVDMDITNVAQDPQNLNLYRFTLENTHVTYANTLRRLIMTGVETVAFNADMKNGTTSDVTILKNDSPMTNEMLAHRIGLLPITYDNPIHFDTDTYTFVLQAKGKPDTSTDVTCANFTITQAASGEGKEPTEVPVAKFFPPNPISKQSCLIATLPAGNTELHVIAKASKGAGRVNARYQPTSQCSYTYTLDDDRERRETYLDKWLRETKMYPYTEEDKETPKYKAYVREFQTMEINRIYKQLPNGEPYSFDFVVESIGTLEIPYIIKRACEVGRSMMGRFINIDTPAFNPKEHGMTIQPSVKNPFGIDFILEHQDHTFGNMIQTYLAENHMADTLQEGSRIQPIVYVGYEIPHQLRDEMVLRIGVDITSTNPEKDARSAFAQACTGCYSIFDKMEKAFARSALKPVAKEGFVFGPSSSSSSSSSSSAAAPPKRKYAPKGTAAAKAAVSESKSGKP